MVWTAWSTYTYAEFEEKKDKMKGICVLCVREVNIEEEAFYYVIHVCFVILEW